MIYKYRLKLFKNMELINIADLKNPETGKTKTII